FPSNYGDPPPLPIVLIIEPAAGRDGSITNLAVLGRDAEHLAAGRAIIADGPDILALEDRGNCTQEFRLIADGEVIAISYVVRLSRLVAAGHCGNPAGKYKHNVLPKFGQVSVLPAAEAFP